VRAQPVQSEKVKRSLAPFACYLSFTPAMAAGVTKRLWEMSDVVNMLEAWEAAVS
jgi:hypothetical protein